MSDAETRADETNTGGVATDDRTGGADETVRATAPAETWQAIVEPVETLVSECRVRFGPSGLTLRATDPAKAALVAVAAEPSAFETYRASETTIGVSVDRLAEVVGLADGETTVTLRPETRRLRIEAGGVAYETTVLEPDRVRDAPRRTALESEFGYEASFGTDAAAIAQAVRAAELVSDHLVVRGDDGGVAFEAVGDTDECVVRLDAEALQEPSLGPAESIFSLDYLSLVDRAIPSDTAVSVWAGDETPMAVEYDVADGVGVEWLISPRIER